MLYEQHHLRSRILTLLVNFVHLDKPLAKSLIIGPISKLLKDRQVFNFEDSELIILLPYIRASFCVYKAVSVDDPQLSKLDNLSAIS